MENPKHMDRLLCVVLSLVLVGIALFSALYVADFANLPSTYQEQTSALDSNIDTVLALTGTSTIASAAVSAIPGDTATPIAEKLADFTEYFLLILSVLYAEKYLLSLIGIATFRFIVPIVCVLLIIGLFKNPSVFHRLALKLLAFGCALYFALPVSVLVSEKILGQYQTSIDQTIAAAEELSENTSALRESSTDENVFKAVWEKISQSVNGLTTKAAAILSNFVETLAVMIVTSCIIPILVVLFFVWLVKYLTGLESLYAFSEFLPKRRKP